MSVGFHIESERKGKTAEVRIPPDKYRPAGVVAYTEPLRDFQHSNKFFISPTYGANMAVDASIGGTPQVIHNGTDSAAWTGSNLSGSNFVFNSTAQAQAGTKSIDGTATVSGNIALIDKGSNQATSSYAAVSGYIYITSWDTRGNKDVLLQMYLSTGAGQVGNSVGLAQFIDTSLFNTWQKFVIPMDDFAPGATIDGITIETLDIGAGPAPDFYLDTIQLEESGGGDFYVYPDDNTKFHLQRMVVTVLDSDNAGTLADASMPNLAYNKILGLSALSTGIVVQKTGDENGSTSLFNGTIQSLSDMLLSPQLGDIQSGSDGTGSWLRVTFDFCDNCVVLNSKNSDQLRIDITEDLTALTSMVWSVTGYAEPLESE